jgi:hypothetical protein
VLVCPANNNKCNEFLKKAKSKMKESQELQTRITRMSREQLRKERTWLDAVRLVGVGGVVIDSNLHRLSQIRLMSKNRQRLVRSPMRSFLSRPRMTNQQTLYETFIHRGGLSILLFIKGKGDWFCVEYSGIVVHCSDEHAH